MRRLARRGLGAAATAALLILATGAPALAQQAGATPGGAPEDTAGVASVSQLYNQGVEAAKKNDWPKAYESFLAAWKIKEHYQIAANLGRAEIKIGKHRYADEHLAYFLREAKGVSADDRKKAQELLNEAKQHVGTLIIKVNRPSAEVVIDGQVVGMAPLSREIYVDPGSHTVDARLGTEKAEPVTVDLSAGQSRQVGLTFGGGGGAEKPRGPQPPDAADEGEGGPKLRSVLIGAGIGVGALGVTAGIITTALSFGKAADRNEACGESGVAGYPLCTEAEWKNYESPRTALANAAIAGFAVGSAVLGVTLVYAFSGSSSEDEAGVKMGMRVQSDGAGIVVRGSW